MPETKTYTGISRDELVEIRSRLEKQGVTVPAGDKVEVSAPHGVFLDVAYDEPVEVLTITIAKKPFLVPESMIWNVIDSGIKPYEEN